MAIRGRGSTYLLSWLERGAAQDGGPVPIDERLWLNRLQQLTPVRLCPVSPGGSGPDPACTLDVALPR